MVLYNVTVSIDNSVHEDWLQWMRSTHIPEVMETGCFIESRISRVHGEEEGGMTFAITYVSPSDEHLKKYEKEHALALQKDHSSKFQGKFAAFRTTLSVIEEFKK
jgi:hypothetical protein